MTKTAFIKQIQQDFNAFELLGIMLMLFLAFAFQIVLNELPCPLCLLQRLGFLGVAFGFLLNLRFGLKPSHYAIALISALFTSFVALRQIALHVVPGTGVYGDAIFGLHLYTWSFIVSMLIVIVTILMLGCDQQYQVTASDRMYSSRITRLLFGATVLLIIANIISVLLECGLAVCPDNPVHYLI